MVTHDPVAAAYADRVSSSATARSSTRWPTRRPRTRARPHEARSATDASMSTQPRLIARRSIRARIGRLHRHRDRHPRRRRVRRRLVRARRQPAQDVRRPVHAISEDVDLEVRARWPSARAACNQQRDPVPAALADTSPRRGRPGRRAAAARYAQLVDKRRQGGHDPGRARRSAWRGPGPGAVRPGSRARGSRPAARPGRHRQGDRRPRGLRGRRHRSTVITDTGTHHLHDHRRSSASATATASPAPRSRRSTPPRPHAVLGAGGFVDAIDVAVADGVDPADGAGRDRAGAPTSGTEVVTGEVRRRGGQGRRRQVHRRLRQRPARSSPSSPPSSVPSSSTTSSQITIGQRLRELALLRADRRHRAARCGG